VAPRPCIVASILVAGSSSCSSCVVAGGASRAAGGLCIKAFSQQYVNVSGTATAFLDWRQPSNPTACACPIRHSSHSAERSGWPNESGASTFPGSFGHGMRLRLRMGFGQHEQPGN
jgi:hypothetical protein